MADDNGERRNCDTLLEFLRDEYVQSLLRDRSTAFGPPSDATKTEFDTKTAAIHVTPTPNDKYDVNVIKEDATWLSKSANLNLVAALRITVLEFQNSPAGHLAGPLSTQDAVNFQEAAGVSNGQTSSLLPLSGVTMDAETIWAEFEKKEMRRLRIFQTYLAERRYLSMAAELDHAASLPTKTKAITAGGKEKQVAREDRSKQVEDLVASNLKTVSKIMESLSNGYERETDDKSIQVEELEVAWHRTLLTEIIHSLSIVFQALDSQGDFFSAPETVMEWFRLMESCGFFEGIMAVRSHLVR